MGLFRRLFGRKSQNDHSYVRLWVEQHQQELHNSNDLSMGFFVAVMDVLLSFGNKDKRQSIPSELNLGFDATSRYSGDAALFELGCYIYFRLDLWLHQHKPEHREDISIKFGNKFTELFTQALNSKDIPALFDQRISQYAKLARTGADAEKYHFHLSQLILRAQDEQPPKTYDFDNEPLMITGIFEGMGVKIGLVAWEQGMIPALIKTLEKYCDIIDTSGDIIEITALRETAQEGDMEAQADLGRIYYLGEGVSQDDKEAAKWFRKAAEQGHATAQGILGGMYSFGEGVPQNDKEAIKWYKKAAEQKDMTAQFHLGEMFCGGRGVPKDYKEAVKWLRKAAEQEVVFAQWTLGRQYFKGEEIERNHKEAVKWAKKLVEKAKEGCPEAQLLLMGVSNSIGGFNKKAAVWFREAGEHATDGDSEAEYFLGMLYDSGIARGFQDQKEVTKWFKQMSEKKIVPAQHLYTLGEMYCEGEGVRRDFKEAVRFFIKAAEQGSTPAQDRLQDFKPEFINECLGEAEPRKRPDQFPKFS